MGEYALFGSMLRPTPSTDRFGRDGIFLMTGLGRLVYSYRIKTGPDVGLVTVRSGEGLLSFADG